MDSRLRSIAALALLVGLLGFGAAPSYATAVTEGEITIGQGAGGIKLGMTRAQVIGKLGKPFYENANGYMEYGTGEGQFDVYRESGSRRSRVRMLGIFGTGFRLSDGNAIFETGGIARLRKRYGKRLKRVHFENGERIYRINSRSAGRWASTDLTVDRWGSKARVGTIFMYLR
jgi:hypothetical protein